MITVNAMGENCPIPVIKTKKALQQLNGNGIIEVLVDNETAVQNVMKMAASMGAKAQQEQLGKGEYKIVIEKVNPLASHNVKSLDMAAPDLATHNVQNTGKISNTIVSVSSDRMGSGNDELGKVLLKGFIFAVTQLDELPRAMLFYNGGATLTAEGSDSIEDLKNLEAQGVEVLTCGTCLNYYELTDKLQVGSVTNMYTIVEKMSEASNIIQP